MFWKIVIGIIGAATVAVVAGVIYYLSRKNKNEGIMPESSEKATQRDTDVKDVVKGFRTKKLSFEEAIRDRHIEAGKVIKESVEKISHESEKRVTKNEDTKKQMFDDLNNI